MLDYDFKNLEKKYLEKNHKIKIERTGKDIYILEMFPYPSGDIHVGHVRNYVIGEVLSNFYSLKNYKVFRPMGWDSFGLPAENASIENGLHPRDWTEKNIANMKKTLQKIGFSYDWSYEISTCDVSYYKHQQRIFIEFFKKGLVSRKKDWVNWDPVLNTVLANEQVDKDGKSWRSGAIVEKRQIEQWFLNISKYSDILLKDLETLEGQWPEKVITMQRNWIGKSEGFILKFQLYDKNFEMDIFTTRPETVFGCNFLVTSPKSDIARKINSRAVEEFESNPTEISSKIIGYAINSYNKRKIPIYFVDYVLENYGTGIVMGVGSEDERDRNFAIERSIENIEIIKNELLINSEFLNGLTAENARKKISENLEKKYFYKLKDWCLSRQRYWGCPIPIIYCEKCGIVIDENLPVELPRNVEISGTGNPLKFSTWLHRECPKCGGKAQRETDTMDTFVDSSWYFLRFPNAQDGENAIINPKPVDIYLGGIEHAILHLLYARFFTKALHDMNIVPFVEPFKKLVTQGMICHETYEGKDSKKYYFPKEVSEKNGIFYAGNEEVIKGPIIKMSKSKKNVIDPHEIMETFGSDSLKMFVISDSPVIKDFEWNTNSLKGCFRFLQTIWDKILNIKDKIDRNFYCGDENFSSSIAENMISIQEQIEKINLNSYIAQIRIFAKNFDLFTEKSSKNGVLEVLENFLIAIWMICPAISSELYSLLFNGNIENCSWPTLTLEKKEIAKIIFQINGKKKIILEIPVMKEGETVGFLISILQTQFNIKEFSKYFYVPNKLINFIVN